MFAFSLFSFRVKNEGRRARVENRRTINRKEGKEEREGGERERGRVSLVQEPVCYRAILVAMGIISKGLLRVRKILPYPRSFPPKHSFEISNRLIQKEFRLLFLFFFFFQFFHSQGKPSRISLNVLLRSSSSLSGQNFSPEFSVSISSRKHTLPVVTQDSGC